MRNHDAKTLMLSVLTALVISYPGLGAGPVEVIPVEATLHRRHQVCLADVRGTAGRITVVHLVPSVSEATALEGLLVHWYWDGNETPSLVCSIKELLRLFDREGAPVNVPDLIFGSGFRIFVECASGPGGKLGGEIRYERSSTPASPARVRFDPDLGIGSPQAVEPLRLRPPGIRLGRGEAIEIANGGFESGVLSPWRDVSWDSSESTDHFRVYPSGTEGVRPRSGAYMAGVVRGGNSTGMTRVAGLVPGYRYRLSASVNTWGVDEQGHADKARARIGINTVGSFLVRLHPEEGELWTTEFSHEKFYFGHCWAARFYALSHDHWSRIAVDTRARGEIACVFLEGSQLLGDVRKWILFDDIMLENIPIPMGVIRGRVTNARGEGVADVLLVTDPWSFACRTQADGRYELMDLPEGVYILEAQRGTQYGSVANVRVLGGGETEVRFAVGESITGEIVSAPPGEKKNQLINGGFESGDLVGWSRCYESDAMGVAGASRRVAPIEGAFMFGGEHVYHQAGAREILYQRVPVSRGSKWTFSGLLFAHSADGSEEEAACQLVVDPKGGTDFGIASARHNGEWKEMAVSFVAEADAVTVGVALNQRPRTAGGLSDDRGIVGSLPREDVRTDYNGYYCDELCLVAATADSELSQVQPRPGRPEVAAGVRPAFPDAPTAIVTLPDGKTTMELIRIPAGTFLMGGDSRSGWAGDDEFPRHRVKLDSYWIGKYEVTNAQYKAFCDHAGYPYPPDPAFSKIPWVHRDRRYHYGDYFTAMPDHPVVNVTWHDACAFCRWAGLRLPTEAEWEMAARGHGDSVRTYPWGEQTDPSWTIRTRDNLSIQTPDGNLYTCPVGKFEKSPRPYNVGTSAFGVCGMGGNVREWCADWYGAYTEADQVNPRGPVSGTSKVLRGGCWRGRDYGVMTRCSYRHHHDPDYYEWGTTGFRVAADVR